MSIAYDKIEPQYIHNFYSNMELPDDVLQIIKEYSKPVTRPDWRTLHKMPQYIYKYDCYSNYFKNTTHKIFNANNLARIFIKN